MLISLAILSVAINIQAKSNCFKNMGNYLAYLTSKSIGFRFNLLAQSCFSLPNHQL